MDLMNAYVVHCGFALRTPTNYYANPRPIARTHDPLRKPTIHCENPQIITQTHELLPKHPDP